MTATREPLLTAAGLEAVRAVSAEFADALMLLATSKKPAFPTVEGAQLHEGSVIVDLAGDEHTIHHFKEYPARFVGDHARRAYENEAETGWCCTVRDHEPFHCREEK